MRKLAWILAAALLSPLLTSGCDKTKSTTSQIKDTSGGPGTYKETPQRKKLGPPD